MSPPVFLPSVNKVDFWRGPARPSLPVDMRIPSSELKDVKAYLESHGLAYSIMIKDIQVRSGPRVVAGVSPSTCLSALGPRQCDRNSQGYTWGQETGNCSGLLPAPQGGGSGGLPLLFSLLPPVPVVLISQPFNTREALHLEKPVQAPLSRLQPCAFTAGLPGLGTCSRRDSPRGDVVKEVAADPALR